ncbi:MAG: energy-coupling factor transporter transmembrane component T [Candidatus Dormiibacterota bacterium]
MNPRALAAWSISGITIALASGNPVYRVLVLLCALNVLVALRRPEVSLRGVAIALVIAAMIAIVVTTLASHTGTHAFLVLPGGIPVAGGKLTVEAVVFGASTGIGIAAAVLAAAPLSLVVMPNSLVDALPGALARTGAAIGTALNLIPGIARSATEIRDAQRMRGWRPRRVREWPDLAVPIVLTALEGSITLAEAMEARGYGSGARTHYSETAWTREDIAVAVLAPMAALTFVALRIGGVVNDWYPFPDVSLPPIDVFGVACCLVLAIPALVWRR